LRHVAPQLRLDARERFGGREGRNLILQLREFLDVCERQEVCARAECLTDLDEGGAERDQVLFKPRALTFELTLARHGRLRAAVDYEAHKPNQLVQRASQQEVARPSLAVVRAPARTRLFEFAFGDAAVEGRAYVVVVQEQVERQRGEHARDLQSPPQGGEAPRLNPDRLDIGDFNLRRRQ